MPAMSLPPVHDSSRALAEADFSKIAYDFSNAGFDVRLPAEGILQIVSPKLPSKRFRLLISVGIHGDETAPIEMVAQLLTGLAQTPHELAVDLMLMVGNLKAIAQARRYLDADLNRMFGSDRGDLQATAEAERADVIMRETATFFAQPAAEKWHLDLHTTIRASLYPTFAVVPDVIAEPEKNALTAWLGNAGIDAVIFNGKAAGTFTAYTAGQFGATSCTAELGQVAVLGTNDLARFSAMQLSLDGLLRLRQPQQFQQRQPELFTVAQEIMKCSDDFKLAFDRRTKNFTSMDRGTVIARDGEIVYRVRALTEYVVFPNPDVRIGQRAGLMLVRRN
jgi:succinylglutamate desuccinylase